MEIAYTDKSQSPVYGSKSRDFAVIHLPCAAFWEIIY